jgi:hypothetical protein
MPAYKHQTLDSARNEAMRLAAGNPGERFIVLYAVGCALLPKPAAAWSDATDPDDIPF